MPFQPKITSGGVEAWANEKEPPKRICFASTHHNALKKKEGNETIGIFSIPFSNTVKPTFEILTNIDLFQSDFGGYYRYIKSEGEFKTIEAWMNDQGSRVYLRDLLALSIALSVNMNEKFNHTPIGDLENRAKYKQSPRAIEKLVELCIETQKSLPFYRDADVITAVPPSVVGKFSLPSILSSEIAEGSTLQNATPSLEWENEKKSLKELGFKEKWAALEGANLKVINDDFKEKNVILIDDLYQSGITMHYVAMKLLQAGAKRVYGLAIVKSLRNTDNL